MTETAEAEVPCLLRAEPRLRVHEAVAEPTAHDRLVEDRGGDPGVGNVNRAGLRRGREELLEQVPLRYQRGAYPLRVVDRQVQRELGDRPAIVRAAFARLAGLAPL